MKAADELALALVSLERALLRGVGLVLMLVAGGVYVAALLVLLWQEYAALRAVEIRRGR